MEFLNTRVIRITRIGGYWNHLRHYYPEFPTVECVPRFHSVSGYPGIKVSLEHEKSSRGISHAFHVPIEQHQQRQEGKGELVHIQVATSASITV